MLLLKNQEDFEKFKSNNEYDVVGEPKEFPCFANMIVTDWSNQEETAEYYYQSDLRDMLKQIKAAQE